MTSPAGSNRRQFLTRSAVATGGLLLASACGGRGQSAQGSPGITDSKITLGGSVPFSGSASAYGVAGHVLQAYFKSINAEGGVKMGDGKTRKINYIVYDDAYDPAQTLENARRLIQQDQVFALFGNLGTPTNTAIVDYVNQQEVPHLFVLAGSSKWGAHMDKWPWTIGWQTTFSLESAIYAQYLKREHPDAKVAILYQNDDVGGEYLNGFKRAIKGTGIEIVAEESYQVTAPSVDSQVVSLAQSDADVFFNTSTPKFAAQAIRKKHELGWDIPHILAIVSASIDSVLKPAGLEASQDIISADYMKNPPDPRWQKDPGMQRYLADAKKYGNFNVNDPLAIIGWAVCDTMIKVLQDTPDPTREAIMQVVRNMNYDNPLLLPNVRIDTKGSNDGFPNESMQVTRFKDKQWEPITDVIHYENKTPVPGK